MSSLTSRNHLILMFMPLPSGLLCFLLFRGNASGGPVEADREARSRGPMLEIQITAVSVSEVEGLEIEATKAT